MSSEANEDLRVELSFLRENVVQAASQRGTATVTAGLDTYEELIREFIAVLKDFNSPYDRDEAFAEMHNVGGGWSELDWVRDDYKEIADAALDSDNFNVIRPVIYFPIRISGMAYEQREYLIFAQFLGWVPYLYRRSVDRICPTDQDLFEIVRDRLPQYLYELAGYRIGHDLNESNAPESIRKSCDFAREVFANFNRLLKAAYDKRRAVDFAKFASDFQSLFEHEADRFSYRLLEAPPEVTEEDDRPDDVRTNCYRRLFELRQIIFLGLDAWILRDYERRDRTNKDTEQAALFRDEILRFRGSLFIPSSIPELWRLALAVRDWRDQRYESELEWTWWESAEHSGRGAYAGIDFGDLILRGVLLRMLATATSLGHDQVMSLDLELTRDLDYLISSGTGPLITMLDGMATSTELRSLVEFSDRAYEDLRARFLALGDQQAELERVQVVEADLSPSRVQELEANIVKGWESTGLVRRLIRRLGTFAEAGQAPEDLNSLSLHFFERKDIFVEGSRFSTSMWGEEWGRSLARGEDEYVIKQIASGGRVISNELVPPEDLASQLDVALEAKPRLRNPVILFVNSVAASWSLSQSGRFQYTRHLDSDDQPPRPSAQFDGYAIYDLYADADPMAIVTDLASVGIWKQYTPAKRSELGSLINPWIYLELEPFDLESAKHFLLDVQPNAFLLAEEPKRRELTLEERIALLRQRVRVLLLEQLEFNITNADAARVIKLTK
jgi:hypothetical protein